MQYTFSIEFWGDVFEDFAQVDRVRVDSSAERLDITIKGRSEILQASQEELDDTLYKFKGNPKEVATFFLRKHGVITYYKDTLVGFFDIVGYSSFLDAHRHSLEDCISKISNFINDACKKRETDFGGVKIDHWALSDSIILVIDTTRHHVFKGSLNIFMGTCSFILRYGMQCGFPLRGAIGGGDFYKDGEVMVSTALVDAARYEKKQEWLGAVLTPEALQVVKKAKDFEIKKNGSTDIDLDTGEFKFSVRHGKIPWKKIENEQKEKFPEETYYIKPFEMSEEDWAIKYLPEHFDGSEKIDNSNVLYALE